MRALLYFLLLAFCVITAGMAYEVLFLNLYVFGEFHIGDIFRALLQTVGTAWCLYQLHIGEKA